MHASAVLRGARLLVAGLAAGTLVIGFAAPAMAADSMPPASGGSGDCSPGLVDGTTAPIYGHMEKAHLERSPAQQVSDLQKTDNYVLIHTEWIEMFTAPARAGLVHIAGETPKPFFGHMEHAHLQRSPGQQAGDLRATDDYALQHTVWIESMAQPSIEVVNGSPCQ
jgi:hypothetical protein